MKHCYFFKLTFKSNLFIDFRFQFIPSNEMFQVFRFEACYHEFTVSFPSCDIQIIDPFKQIAS